MTIRNLTCAAHLRRAALTLVLALAAAPALAQSTYEDRSISSGSSLEIRADDEEMQAAIAHARATLDVFRALVAKHPHGAHLIKVRLPLLDGGDIYKWTVMLEWTPEGPIGVFLQDTPQLKIRRGDRYTVRPDQITDWTVAAPPINSGPIYGDFTTRILGRRDPSKVGAGYAKRHQPLPPTPN